MNAEDEQKLRAQIAYKIRMYCGDSNGYVIDEDDCDGDHDPSGTFIYMGSYPYYNTGDKINSSKTQHKVSSTDPTARSKVGVPARGGFGGNGSKFSTGG